MIWKRKDKKKTGVGGAEKKPIAPLFFSD